MSEFLTTNQVFTLGNEITLPAVGLGTFQGDADNSLVKDAVLAALKCGYRHIDTAVAYGNENDVAVANSLYPERIIAESNRGQTWHKPSDVAEALEQSLENLQMDYGDLLRKTLKSAFPHAYAAGSGHTTIRHPSGNGKPVIDYKLSREYPEVWKAMEHLVDNGKVKSIGLSNFNVLKTKRILEIARIRPMVNQVEFHPYHPQFELLEFCKSEQIHVTAHQPLGGKPVAVVNPNSSRPGPLLNPQIIEIALECGKSPAQVILSWSVQRGASVIPKTVHEDRLTENLGLFRLSDAHVDKINRISAKADTVRYLDPAGHIGFDIFDEVHDQPVLDRAPWDT